MSYTTAVTRSENPNVLQTYLYQQTLENLEPELFFWQMGKKPIVPSGYNTVEWARFSTIADTEITEGSDSTDGVTPAAIAINADVISATPIQYRVVASISDLVQKLNRINFIDNAILEIGNAMARKIDKVIQTVVMAGTYVLYGGTKTARTALASTDVLTASLLAKASTLLESRYAKKIGGYYVAFSHPFALYDLKTETGTGNWLEVSKYARPEQIFKGEVGALNGVRIISAPYIQKFSSTVDVYPTLVMGADAYGVSDFDSLQTYISPARPSDSDPLAQRTKVGSKVAFAAKILEQSALLRIETGVTNLL